MNIIKALYLALVLALLTVAPSAFAHTVADTSSIAHQLAHLVYGFNHMPVAYATALSAVLFALGGIFTVLAWRNAQRAWLAAGGVSAMAACIVLLVAV